VCPDSLHVFPNFLRLGETGAATIVRLRIRASPPSRPRGDQVERVISAGKALNVRAIEKVPESQGREGGLPRSYGEGHQLSLVLLNKGLQLQIPSISRHGDRAAAPSC
jgi:hypothetical protein